MHNLLLVDDEPIIVDSLYRFLSELDELELNIYKAYSGSQAIEIFSKTRIDIVISDISMPNISGIELQKFILKQWPKCRVIFLTAYDEFEYIKAAIRGGSIDYVLKGEGDEAIAVALHKAIENIKNEEVNNQLVEQISIHMEKVMPILQKEFILNLINGESFLKEDFLKEAKELNFTLNMDIPTLMVLTRIDSWNKNTYSLKNIQEPYTIKSIIDSHLNHRLKTLSMVLNDFEVLTFVQPVLENTNLHEKECWDRAFIFLEGTLELIQKSCSKILEKTVSHAVTSKPYHWSNVDRGFNFLCNILSSNYSLETEMILTEEHIQDSSIVDDQSFIVKKRLDQVGSVMTLLESGQQQELEELIADTIKLMRGQKDLSRGILEEAYYSLALAFQVYINRSPYTKTIEQKYDLSSLMKLHSHGGWTNVENYFKGLIECIFQVRKEQNLEKTNKIVKRINQYISEHLYEELSLTTLAEMVQFNPSYLSRLYKQATGLTLSDYIIDLKLQKSKEMLLDDKMKIQNIAKKLGFSSHTYFGRSFRKHFGMTPQEFRDMYIR
jgi:two-component system, response regulator YesN